MRVERAREAAQRGGLAHAGLAGERLQARRLQQPVEALGELFEGGVVPGLGDAVLPTSRRFVVP